MKIKQSRLVGMVVKAGACLGAVLFASTAIADNITTYAGSGCMDGTIPGTPSGLIEGIEFFGGFTRCPLTRIVSDDTTDITTVLIRVQDTTTTDWITCHGVSCNGSGDTCSVTADKHSGTAQSFTGTTYLNMGTLPAYSTGYAYIECSFPSGHDSYVYSYRATD